ncbi:diaminopimelate decarboxylase [Owenweeksia hongkongensis DSM 17368]|uniref:Diaminopimelate decarboxylase n=1 Tax=Owenweeksia hongkongensis (strain DSM 17368 / CIP 108786 / JCM 12287 / NRRL B-23963 / UST20020801) TaxID=926562 RepID=G8R014_OWEHD|nr:diaminopimelate decarboxylase [Owenweeksia hongkongensis]AEV32654.1 diaminopimelate decarboxylase [Owenweeksia hongkongensis DSM 17368]
MQITEGNYQISGVNALDLCKEYGTPLYVYDTAKMEAQYKRLTKAFKGTKHKMNYACKALSNINVLRFFKDLGSGLDTVSIQEVQLGLKAGFAPDDIIFTPNGVSFEEIKKAVDFGVRINIDNLSILEQFGSYYGGTYPVCIRLNPHIMAGGNIKISVGHIDSKFGISIHQTRHLERLVKSLGIKVEGVHMHTGSDILDVDVFLQGADLLLNVARDFPDLKYIDFGSGFKVAYKPNDISTDVEELGKKMTKIFKEFCAEYGRELEIEFEPGKFLVSESGYFFCKVNVIKQTTATVFAGVDTGMNHLIRPMFYDSYHHIENVSNPAGKKRVYTVVGYICETDTFASDRQINEIKEDDILCFRNAGAYCFTMANNYNSRYKPAEVLIHKGKAHLITKRQTLDDLLANQVEIKL